MKRERTEFPTRIRKEVKERARNRCERCGVDFDSDFSRCEREIPHSLEVG